MISTSSKKKKIFQLFQKNISGLPSECQTVWIEIRLKASDLVSVQTVCKGYQQTGKSSLAGRASI